MPLRGSVDEFNRQMGGVAALREHILNAEVDAPTRALVYESALARTFRAYENFVEAVFLSYLAGEETLSGSCVTRHASPSDVHHARKMIGRSGQVLDWASPEIAVERCKVFLDADAPLMSALVASFQVINWTRKIRNHIAHNSAESLTQYEGVVKDILLTLPATGLPKPGEFLQLRPSKGPFRQREVLAALQEAVQQFAAAAAESPPDR